MDARVREHATIIADHSTGIEAGDNVVIQLPAAAEDLGVALHEICGDRGANPVYLNYSKRADRAFKRAADEFEEPGHRRALYEETDVFVIARGGANVTEDADVAPETNAAYNRAMEAVKRERLSKTWCLTQFPTAGHAQLAGMSTEAYEDFVWDAVSLDWEAQHAFQAELVSILDDAEEVRIRSGEDTDLTMRVAGNTATPFDLDRISGGSSGGAGAALADRLVPIAQGSDTGGSIRTPASCCGVVGVKPTYGRVAAPRRPDAYISHTPFSHLGPMARTVDDAALMLEVMAGPHPKDPFSAPDDGTDFRAATDRPVDDMKIAYSPDLGAFPVEDDVREVVGDAVGAFADAGATVEEVDGPVDLSHDEIMDTYYTFATVLWESLFDTLEEDGLDPRGEDRDRLVDSTVETILESESVSTREYAAANRKRTQVYDSLRETLAEYDLLVTPTLGVTPFEHGDLPETVADQSVDRRRGWLLTQPFNFSGHPVASVPAGFADGLPVGMQVVGSRFAEEDVLAGSAAVERQRPWHDAYPE